MIKTIWFDFGGVLSPPIEEMFDIYHNKTGISPNRLKEAMLDVANTMNMPMLAPIENAVLTDSEWGGALRKSLQKLYPNLDTTKAELENFGKQWFAGIKANFVMIWLFKNLKKQGYQLGILTNNVVEWEQEWKGMIDLDEYVDFIVDSCKFSCRKPDKGFFVIAEQTAGTVGHENILIDDVEENCLSAKENGWNTILFQSNAQVLRELQEYCVFDFPNIKDIPLYDFVPTYKVICEADSDRLGVIEILSGHRAYHITNYTDVKNILTNQHCIRKPTNQIGAASILPTLTPDELLLNLDGDEHKRMKDFAMKSYNISHMQSLHDEMLATVQEHLQSVNISNRFDLFPILDNIVLDFNARMLGIEFDFYCNKLKLLTKIIQLADKNNTEKLVDDFMQLYEYIMGMIQGNRTVHQGGIVDMWLQNRNKVNPPLSDKEICGLLLGSILGGYQNVLTGLSKVVYAVLYFPVLWKLLLEDNALISDMINEIFRLTNLGTASTFPRIATTEIRLLHGVVPKGGIVYPDAFLANRDSSVFTNPLHINPFRKNKAHLQFGYGAHHCMGRNLAEIEIQTILQELLLSFPNLTMDSEVEIEWDNSVILHRPKNIPVINLKQ